jgi:hypothetical protein
MTPQTLDVLRDVEKGWRSTLQTEAVGLGMRHPFFLSSLLTYRLKNQPTILPMPPPESESLRSTADT